jgi:hypothetical protein
VEFTDRPPQDRYRRAGTQAELQTCRSRADDANSLVHSDFSCGRATSRHSADDDGLAGQAFARIAWPTVPSAHIPEMLAGSEKGRLFACQRNGHNGTRPRLLPSGREMSAGKYRC